MYRRADDLDLSTVNLVFCSMPMSFSLQQIRHVSGQCFHDLCSKAVVAPQVSVPVITADHRHLREREVLVEPVDGGRSPGAPAGGDGRGGFPLEQLSVIGRRVEGSIQQRGKRAVRPREILKALSPETVSYLGL